MWMCWEAWSGVELCGPVWCFGKLLSGTFHSRCKIAAFLVSTGMHANDMNASVLIAIIAATLLSSGSAVSITSFSASLRWNFAMGSYVKAMPKLSADGLTVYSSSGEGCAATANTMFALSVATGSIQWQVNFHAACEFCLIYVYCVFINPTHRFGRAETAALARSLRATALLTPLPR